MATGDREKTFVEALERIVGKEDSERILCGLGGLADSAEEVSWGEGAMTRLDRDLDPAIRAAVREPCGRACLGSDGVAGARRRSRPPTATARGGGALFAALLRREVEVELPSAILGGASSCRFAVRLGGR